MNLNIDLVKGMREIAKPKFAVFVQEKEDIADAKRFVRRKYPKVKMFVNKTILAFIDTTN